MSKKLLSEAQIRRFQALATIKPLNEMDSSYKKHDDEDKMEEMAYKKHDDEDKMEETYDEAGMKDDEPMESLYEEEDEMDADENMGDADVELDEELVEQFMDAVKTIQQVSDALGGDVEMEMGPEEPMDMGAPEEAPMELDAGDDEEDEEDEEAMLQEALRGISYVPSQKEVVKLVAKRVARRLQEAKKAQSRLDRALGKK